MSYDVETFKGMILYNNKTTFNTKVIRRSSWYRTPKTESFVMMDSDVLHAAKELTLADKTITPPKGSSIYLAVDIPIDINSLRKEYNIKRKPSDADYVVFAPPRTTQKHFYNDCYYYPSRNILIEQQSFMSSDGKTYTNELKDTFNIFGVNSNEGVHIGRSHLWRVTDSKNSWEKYFNNQFTKPVISYTQLDLASGEDLTYDVLALTKRLGGKEANFGTDYDNYILNLKALNNLNWREYKGTLSYLFNSFGSYTVHNNVIRYKGSQGKTVQDIIDSCKSLEKFCGEKDFKLCQEFVMRQLNIPQMPMFTHSSVLEEKVNRLRLSLSDFERLFGAVVKINLKEYDPK